MFQASRSSKGDVRNLGGWEIEASTREEWHDLRQDHVQGLFDASQLTFGAAVRRAAWRRFFGAFIVLAFSMSCVASEHFNFQNIRIDNMRPRRDANGEILDAHDGCLKYFDGRYYLYGTAYGRSAGYSINNRFRVYSSRNLKDWKFDGELLESPPDGVYYRPYVVYNASTKKYVLWYNWYPTLWEGKVGVAISDAPVGPFKIVSTEVKVAGYSDRIGDGSLFVNSDGTGYFIYSTIGQNHSIRIERLTSDFLGVTSDTSGVLAVGCEAPALIRNRDRYYALFDTTCCFCSSGSGVRVLVASSPLGPYTEKANINRQADGRPRVPAQQTFVAQVLTPSGPAYFWMADRWGSRPDGVKGHDLQFWSAPLRFTPGGMIEPIENTPKWSAKIEVGTKQDLVKRPYIWPKKKDPHPLKIDPCTGAPLPDE